jgi:hypothetical protein
MCNDARTERRNPRNLRRSQTSVPHPQHRNDQFLSARHPRLLFVLSFKGFVPSLLYISPVALLVLELILLM